MNRDKLQRLETMLRELKLGKGERFDMDHWCSKRCGTAACAFGWWALKELGDARLSDRAGVFQVVTPHGEVDRGEKEFDLTPSEADYLFHPETYDVGDSADITPVMVADRVRLLLESA